MVFQIGSSTFSFGVEMQRPLLRSPAVPPVPAAESSCTSPHSDALDSAIERLDVMEKAVDGLPIPRLLKPVISTIRTVLQSLEVKITDYLLPG